MSRAESEYRARELWREAYSHAPHEALRAAESVLAPHGLICDGTFVYASIPMKLLMDLRVALMVVVLETRG